MADVITAGSFSGLVESSEQSLTVNDLGAGEARITYHTPWSGLTTSIPQPLTAHPYFPNLKLYDVQASKEEAGVGRVELTYRGVWASNPLSLTQTNTQDSTSTQPIQTHPLFGDFGATDFALIDFYLSNLQNNSSYTPDYTKFSSGAQLTAPDGTQLCKYLLLLRIKGVDSYLLGQIQFTQNFIYDQPPSNGDYAQVGYIVDTSGFTDFPTFSDQRNWICTSISSKKSGGYYSIEIQYLLSGPLGYEKNLYQH